MRLISPYETLINRHPSRRRTIGHPGSLVLVLTFDGQESSPKPVSCGSEPFLRARCSVPMAVGSTSAITRKRTSRCCACHDLQRHHAAAAAVETGVFGPSDLPRRIATAILRGLPRSPGANRRRAATRSSTRASRSPCRPADMCARSPAKINGSGSSHSMSTALPVGNPACWVPA